MTKPRTRSSEGGGRSGVALADSSWLGGGATSLSIARVGKGRALAWLSERAAAPVAFIDDSVAQHGSAAKHAPQVMRFHMVVPDILKPIIGVAEGAAARVDNWAEAAPLIRRALTDGI